MLIALSDTHRDAGHGLADHRLTAVREADVVCHAGDFTTVDVYESFLAEASRLEAVHGNVDDAALRERLPPTRVFEYGDVRLVLVHGHEHDETGLTMLARQEDADVVLSGHTHRPVVRTVEGRVFCNPGSHADPRGATPGHGELTAGKNAADGATVEIKLVDADGAVFERVTV